MRLQFDNFDAKTSYTFRGDIHSFYVEHIVSAFKCSTVVAKTLD